MSSFISNLKQHNHFTPGFFDLTLRAVERIKHNAKQEMLKKEEKEIHIEIPVFKFEKQSCGRYINNLLRPQEQHEYQKMNEKNAIQQAELITDIIFKIYGKFYGYFSDVPARMDLEIRKAKDIFIVLCLKFKIAVIKLHQKLIDSIRDLSGFAKNALRRMQRETLNGWKKLKDSNDIVKIIAGGEVSEHVSFSKLPVDSDFVYKVGNEKYLVAEMEMAGIIAGFHNTIGQWEREPDKKMVVAGTHEGSCLMLLPASLIERLRARENEQIMHITR